MSLFIGFSFAQFFTQPWVASGGRRYGAVGSRVGLIIQRSSVRSRLAATSKLPAAQRLSLTIVPETRYSSVEWFFVGITSLSFFFFLKPGHKEVDETQESDKEQ